VQYAFCSIRISRSWGLREPIFETISREQLEKDVQTVDDLSRGETETRYFDELIGRYNQMRRFLPDAAGDDQISQRPISGSGTECAGLLAAVRRKA